MAGIGAAGVELACLGRLRDRDRKHRAVLFHRLITLARKQLTDIHSRERGNTTIQQKCKTHDIP